MMPRIFVIAALGVFLAVNCIRADEPARLQDSKVGEITLKTPKSWKQSKPTSQLRLSQFEIPASEGDKEAAELAIFSFAGGSVEDNIKRWTEQFQPAERQVKTTKAKSALGEYVLVDVSGTYLKPVGPPIARKTEPMPGARMLAVILAVEGQGNYFLKLTGPAKTVTASAEAFRTSFGGKADDEKPYELE
jgi:gluconolactonase